jgi:P27 family predicted phage terminase small subunit
MAGRRPKPTEVKMLEGNPGKRRLPELMPQLPVGAPDPPESINADAIALAEWCRIAPELVTLNLLSVVDMAALAGYCQAFSMWQQASASIEEDGILLIGPLGPRKNPAVGIMYDAWKQVRAFAQEFGLSPASRAKVTHSPSENSDAVEEWLFEPEDLGEEEFSPLPRMGPHLKQ